MYQYPLDWLTLKINTGGANNGYSRFWDVVRAGSRSGSGSGSGLL